MSATGLEVFDKTLQTTHIWLNEIGEQIGPDTQRCYHALRAVLHALRDRLSVNEAAQLSAQLPMLVRGIFYEGYHPAGKPDRVRSQEEFLAEVGKRIGDVRPIDPRDATIAVFRVLEHHVPAPGLLEMIETLPADIRVLFTGGRQVAQEQSGARPPA